MRNGYFLSNRIRQKFVIWFPDITEDKGRSEVETQAFYHTALAQYNEAHISYADVLQPQEFRWAGVAAMPVMGGIGVGKKLLEVWALQI